MKNKRYNELMYDLGAKLTDEEISEGWHFCAEWDGLLIGPGMPGLESCTLKSKTELLESMSLPAEIINESTTSYSEVRSSSFAEKLEKAIKELNRAGSLASITCESGPDTESKVVARFICTRHAQAFYKALIQCGETARVLEAMEQSYQSEIQPPSSLQGKE